MHFQRRLWKFSLNGKAFEDSWHQRLELVSCSSTFFTKKPNPQFRIFTIFLSVWLLCWKNENDKYLVHQMLKVRQSWNDFFKQTFPPKKWTNIFCFTTMKPQVDLFLFIFWRKLNSLKRHLEKFNLTRSWWLYGIMAGALSWNHNALISVELMVPSKNSET